MTDDPVRDCEGLSNAGRKALESVHRHLAFSLSVQLASQNNHDVDVLKLKENMLRIADRLAVLCVVRRCRNLRQNL